MTGLWLGKTGDANAWYHITLIAKAPVCSFLHVVRYDKPVRDVDAENIRYHTFKPGDGLLSFWRIFRKGRTVLKKESIDFIITFNTFPYGIISWLLALFYKKKLILAFIGADYNTYFKKNISRQLLLKALNKSDIIICKGHHMTQGLIDAGILPEKIEYYPHFVSDYWFTDDEYNNHQDEYDIITVCELIQRKRINIILDAIKLLYSQKIMVKTCIVGNGPELINLKMYLKDLDIEDFVTFTGFQKDIKKYLLRSKIFVQASAGEGLSLSLLEAFCAGLVPITTKAGSEEDIIDDKTTGLFIKTDDPTDLAEKIKLLLNKLEYNKIKQNILNVRSKFSLQNALIESDRILNKLKNV